MQVSGDPEDPGFAGSWWTAVVVRQQRRGGVHITVRYDEVKMRRAVVGPGCKVAPIGSTIVSVA